MRAGIFTLILALLTGCSTANKPPAEPEGEMSAGMDKEAIRAVIREHLIPIRHCYEKELKVNPHVNGKLILEWDIEAGGKVTRTLVKKSVVPAIDNCIAVVIKGAKFPEPPKGSIGRVSYPFVFSEK